VRFARSGAAAFLGVVVLGSTGAPQTPTFPSDVELVRIDVVVLDKNGQPVTGLTAADFEVTEGGKAHEIASFEPVVVRVPAAPTGSASPPAVSGSMAPTPEENRYFLIFFDDVHVSASATTNVRTQLAQFVDRETHEGDWVTIVSPLAGLRWTARTAYERRQLPAVIQSLKGQLVRNVHRADPSAFAAMQASEYGGREYRAPPNQFTPLPAAGAGTSSAMLAEEVYAVAKRRVRQSLSGLSDAILSMAGFRGRKSLVVYSEGFVRSPSMPDYDHAIEIARRTGVSVRVQDPRGLGTGEGDGPTLISLDTEAGGLSFVATETGGSMSMSNDLVTPLREAAVEASAYYLIGFQPSAGEAGERKFRVRVRGDGFKIRAPNRYLVGSPAPAAKPVPPAVRALGQVTDSTEIPLRVATLLLGSSPGAGPTTTFAVELPPGEAAWTERQLTLLIEARPLGKGEAVRDTSDVTLPPSDQPGVATRELHLPPGVWQARVVVRDPATEKVGSVLHTFEVPVVTGLQVSSPILGNKLSRSRVPRAEVRLERRYRRTDALYCQYHVLGAALDPATRRPRVSGAYAIVRGDVGVQEGAASPIEPDEAGEVRRLMGIGLADFPPGDYTLVLRVTDEVSGDSREIRELFSVGE